ncbi:unnamed protein product [Adineta ricciae]|uniref:Uncharacterized protein n=1 Tax=Adineta ricciae TaxID=249248 RepID=A0A816ED41_ADIRI|nr:unnamed protein product [Adineta ricciae]CAF1645167.1 unnamed protein product [Adineta ricciae]
MVFMDSSELTTSIKSAVRHLKQLGGSFQTNTFTENDLNNIDSVAETLMILEKEILKLYSEYETESIDSSRLRHRLKLLPVTIKNEIQEAIKMARVSNLSVIQQLQNELDKYLQQVRDCTEQDKNYLKAIQDLQAEKKRLQDQYNATINEVNERLSQKAALQIKLNETRDAVRETNKHTFDLEEDIMALKERIMQERNDARKEKARLEGEIATTTKQFEEQDHANQVLKRDVDLATNKLAESEMQLRTVYRERERFENERDELQQHVAEQTELFEMEQQEHDRLLREQLELTEAAAIALLDYQAKKADFERRAKAAHEGSSKETENLKVLKKKHDDLLKEVEERTALMKSLENSIEAIGRELEEIKKSIAEKLEQTSKLNMENAEATKELEAMRQAHYMMLDSLKIQMETLDKELQTIRNTRVAKQKEREALLKSIEKAKLTVKDNEIKHNRFVTQTTAKIKDLTERKAILEQTAQEDQIRLTQLQEQISSLKEEYQQMKTRLEKEIKFLEEDTVQLLISIDTNREKIIDNTPEYERLLVEHEKVSAAYEAAKELMIETKRKKQDVLDKIAQVEREIREKIKSRDIAIVAVKECQRETQEQMQKTHEEVLKLEEDIYDKGCRLETLEAENERFRRTIEYLKSQIDLFNRFTNHSSADLQSIDSSNFDLLGVLKIGWNKDRQIENTAAQKDLEYIDILTALLKQTEKRKVKVGSVVTRLIGELQQLKYYLEGMSNPATPMRPLQMTSLSQQSRTGRNASNERERSSVKSPLSQSDPSKSRRRSPSGSRGDRSARSPTQTHDDTQRRPPNSPEIYPPRPSSSRKKP